MAINTIESSTHTASQIFHVFLVEPADSLNVGAVARAMMNLGFSNLHLIAPKNYNADKATITACWATDILETLRISPDLDSAIGDMQEVIGFSTRQGRYRSQHLSLAEWIEKCASGIPTKTALLFGPEDNGLREEHCEQCRYLIRIPSTAEFPSYNLAQAVLLVLYELGKLHAAKNTHEEHQMPAWKDFRQLDLLIDEVLRQSGFYHHGTPGSLPAFIKNMFRRLTPDQREMQILLGLFSRIEGTLRGRFKVSESL